MRAAGGGGDQKCYCRRVRQHPIALLLVLSTCLGGCGEDYGTVTLSWQVIDREGERIFPRGLFDPGGFQRNACGLPARLGTTLTTYDIGVRLEICDPQCAMGCEHPECLVDAPAEFSCRTYRGADMEVPASGQPYRFTLRPVLDIELTQQRCLTPTPACVAVPGPRDRVLHPGLTVDLEVYQIAIDVDASSGEHLNLETCGCA